MGNVLWWIPCFYFTVKYLLWFEGMMVNQIENI